MWGRTSRIASSKYHILQYPFHVSVILSAIRAVYSSSPFQVRRLITFDSARFIREANPNQYFIDDKKLTFSSV